MISGLNKFDADLVAKVARAAAAGGGTHIDIACDPDLVRAAKAVSNVPVRGESACGEGASRVVYRRLARAIAESVEAEIGRGSLW